MAFWQDKKLAEFSSEEWESLCDGCGRCCMWKFEDEDSGEILYTDVACRLFDIEACRCTNYEQRRTLMQGCMDIKTFSPGQFAWLPETCAYRLLFEGKPLYGWHPLISGNSYSVQAAGVSMSGRAISPEGLSEEEIIARIIDPDESGAEI